MGWLAYLIFGRMDQYGLRTGSVRALYGLRTGSVRFRTGSVRTLYGLRTGSVRAPYAVRRETTRNRWLAGWVDRLFKIVVLFMKRFMFI